MTGTNTWRRRTLLRVAPSLAMAALLPPPGRAEPDRATADIVEFLGRGLVDPALIHKALTSEATTLIADPRMIVESTRQLQAVQQAQGTLSTPVDIDALFDFSFHDAAARP